MAGCLVGVARRVFPCRFRQSFGVVAWLLQYDLEDPPPVRHCALRDEFALDGEGEDGFAEVGGGDDV